MRWASLREGAAELEGGRYPGPSRGAHSFARGALKAALKGQLVRASGSGQAEPTTGDRLVYLAGASSLAGAQPVTRDTRVRQVGVEPPWRAVAWVVVEGHGAQGPLGCESLACVLSHEGMQPLS